MKPNNTEIVRRSLFRFAALGAVFLGATCLLGCEDSGKKSAQLARAQVAYLAQAAREDARELEEGMPEGAARLSALFEAAGAEVPDSQSARSALEKTRNSVQDLRTAKSTFFAVASSDGTILRNDQEQDDMVGKNLFEAYGGLKAALKSGYTVAEGEMEAARGVNGRPDRQRVVAVPISVDSTVRGLYVSGWSWSSYAYRLETSLRSQVLSDTEPGGKVPLLYVYVVSKDAIFGAPVSPEISGKAILKQSPLEKAHGKEIWSAPLEIDGRSFGVAVQRVVELGPDVAIAVLRSET